MKPLKFLIVSGPTREPLDPVRFLSNYSTGTMGRYLADAASKRRHRVTWVRCPDDAETAIELLALLKKEAPKHDVFIMAAAVCDVRPEKISAVKLKKDGLRGIRLVKNPDILATLARSKKRGQVFIGFGLESEAILERGYQKLVGKGLELILLQRVIAKKLPFGETAVEAYLLSPDKRYRYFPSIRKPQIAELLVREAEALKKEA